MERGAFLRQWLKEEKILDASGGGQMTVVKPESNCHECQLFFIFI